MTALITEPGVYDIPADQYHADPVAGGSLSSSGARALLPPSCPARFHYERTNPPAPKAHFDIGHAAHQLVLGTGPEIVVIDADSWRTKAAKEARDEAHAAGKVPLLAEDAEMVEAMATALRRSPAAALFDPDQGAPEQTLIWQDDRTGVWCRARLDWLPTPGAGRLIVPDYKTCASADAEALSRAGATWWYPQQAAWYLAGARALDLAGDDAAFVFIAQEKIPPYLVHLVEFDHVAMQIGAGRNRRAIDIYRNCETTGRWPGYGDGQVSLLSLPRWAEIAEGAHDT